MPAKIRCLPGMRARRKKKQETGIRSSNISHIV